MKPKSKDLLKVASGNSTFKKWNEQTHLKFGFIPLADFNIPECDKNVKVEASPLERHRLVVESGKHNFLGPQIIVPSQFKIKNWETALEGYWDRQLLYLIKYGFPLDFKGKSTLVNHKSALQFPQQVCQYIAEEKSHKALVGPFEDPPIEGLHVSPLLSRPKECNEKCRIIMDLSFPPL